MFKKGKRIILSYGSGVNQTDLDAEVDSENPLQIRLVEGKAKSLPQTDKNLIFNLKDPVLDEVILSARIDRILSDEMLILKPLGNLEMRQFVRVTAWLDIYHETASEEEAELDLDAFVEPELGQPLPELNRGQMKILAQTEEASEAVLYLIEAVQALDKKIEAMAAMTRELIDRSFQSNLSRQQVSISGSGVRFQAETPYEIGASINLRMRFSKRLNSEIIARAEVVRIDAPVPEKGEKPVYGVACKFSRIREIDREQIISFAVQKQRESIRRLRAKESF